MNITIAGEPANCQELYLGGLLGVIPDEYCSYITAAATACCGTANEACPICPDGESVTRPNNTIPVDGIDITCMDLEVMGMNGEIDPAICPIAQNAAPTICGCGPPASDVCNICPEGQEMTNPDFMLPLPGGGSESCASLEMRGSQGELTQEQCTALQAAAPGPCGCDGASANPPCVICTNGVEFWCGNFKDQL